MNLMEKFINGRRKLKFISRVSYESSSPRPYLHIKDPEVLAGFASYVKLQCFRHNKNSEVFFRGQNNDHPCIPSLLRDTPSIATTTERLNQRYDAYRELVKKVPDIYNASRFMDEDINPILQHYGIRTPWIDLVDNLFVAIWFATKQYDIKSSIFLDSKEKFGWIYFFKVKEHTENCDLRKNYSSLSLRLHVQHGISVTKKVTKWTLENRGFDNLLVGLVKFPNNKKYILNNYLFSSRFLFPKESFDNTYKYLKKNKFTKLLKEIHTTHHLAPKELGEIWSFSSKS